MIDDELRWEMKAEAYRRYALGEKREDIAFALGVSTDTANCYYKDYARVMSLPYPIHREAGEYEYNLRMNGIPLSEVARVLGKDRCSVSRAVTLYCKRNNLERPAPNERRAQAYFLKVKKGLTYREIAAILGYASKNTCKSAVRAYSKQVGNRGFIGEAPSEGEPNEPT